MRKSQKIPIKVGNTVKILSGSNKGKIGEVLKLYSNNGKILVRGVNLKYKHIKPSKKNEIGEIKQIEAPIHHSNVKLNLK